MRIPSVTSVYSNVFIAPDAQWIPVNNEICFGEIKYENRSNTIILPLNGH